MHIRMLLTLLLNTLPLFTLAAELSIETTLPVTCERKTKKGDKVDVHYRGTLASDGSEFDASYSRGVPLSFELGAGRVIKGWDNGLLDMCIGEKRTLTIPPELGYGQRAMGPIPAGSTLIFETELMGIKGVKKDEL
jgi:FK506-binding protein 2